MLRRLLPAAILSAGALTLSASPSAAFPTGYTISPTTSVQTGVFVTLTATYTGDTCDGDARIFLLASDQSTVVSENGTGGGTDQEAVLLDIQPPQDGGEPGDPLPVGDYWLRVTCDGQDVGALTAFEITAAPEPEPEPEPVPEPQPEAPAADPVQAEADFTG